jgi:branched-chain amino acid transport system substrate-binding protein
MLNTRSVLITVIAALVLAGCASSNNNPTPTSSTQVTTTSTTPSTTTTTPTISTPTVVTPSPIIPKDLTLNLGIFMPITGALSTLGPDMRDGALMAVDDVNALSATTHLTIKTDVKDDGTTDTSGDPAKFNAFVSEGDTGVVGPCCSGVTAAILDLAVQNNVVVASPSATSPSLTVGRADPTNQGYFWRISPSDAVQGKVDAKILQDDGMKTAVVVYVNNAYGSGLNTVFGQVFGSSNIKSDQPYNEVNTGDFSNQVTAVCAQQADALVIFGYIADGANILKEMQKQGCLTKFHIYGSEGLYSSDSTKGLPVEAGCSSGSPPCQTGTWLAAGVKGTNPQSGDLSRYNAKFHTKYGHDPQQYSAESYDAVTYIALAVLKAQSVSGPDYRNLLPDIANSGEGKTSCGPTFAECAPLILAGTPINFDGFAHNFDFDQNHEPKTGVYSEWAVGDDGNTTTIKTNLTAS